MSPFEPGDRVIWSGAPATVIGVIDRPALILEFEGGARVTVAASVVSSAAEPERKT